MLDLMEQILVYYPWFGCMLDSQSHSAHKGFVRPLTVYNSHFNHS